MSELAQIQKAIEESQSKMTQLFDAQKAEIESTGKISKQLQDDLAKVNDEMQKSGARLFDLEQKLASGAENPAEKKSFAERAAEELKKSWDGKQGSFEAKTFNKSLGSDAASAGSLIQPMQVTGYSIIRIKAPLPLLPVRKRSMASTKSTRRLPRLRLTGAPGCQKAMRTSCRMSATYPARWHQACRIR